MGRRKPVAVLLLAGLFLMTACGMNGLELPSLPKASDPVPHTEGKGPVLVSMFTTADVNARKADSMSSEVRYVLPKATEVGLMDQSGDWSRIMHEGEVSFVASRYLSLENPVAVPVGEPAAEPADPVEEPGKQPVEDPVEAPVVVPEVKRLIVIDAGHQARGSAKKEPNGPGATQMKARVSSGTVGVSTGIYEYELNLTVTLKLRDELEKRGYAVMLVRDSHDVDISNVERAEFANENQADAFIRIHANGSEDKKVKGMLTICQTSANPYNASMYKESYRLSDVVLRGMVERTGAVDRDIWQTDTMTGINWSKVPSTIVEMGYMSNPEEDVLLNTEAYQDKIVAGIADGLDAYFR